MIMKASHKCINLIAITRLHQYSIF